MRHLVQDRLGAPLVGVAGDLGPEDVVLEERHRAGILHRARVELRHEQLVVLAEGIRHTEVLVVEAEALLGLREETLGVHELGEGRAAVEAEGDRPVLVGVAVGPLGVRTRDERNEIGAHPWGGAEEVLTGRCSGGLHCFGIRDHLPVGGGGDRQIEGGLEIGLVEAREHPLGVGRLELRVQVHRVVGRIDEPVKALARIRVEAVGVDDEFVVRGESGQCDAGVLGISGHVHRRAVERGRMHGLRDQIDEGRRTLGRIERHGGDGTERGGSRRSGPVGEVEDDGVVVDAQDRCPLGGLLAGQVRWCHRRTPSHDGMSVGPSHHGRAPLRWRRPTTARPRRQGGQDRRGRRTR